MKKFMLPLLLALTMTLAACHWAHCAEKELTIGASTYPLWLLAGNIVQGAPHVKLELLAPANAGCPHDLGLTPADLQKLGKIDILLINGLGLESFLAKPLSQLEKQPELIDASHNVPVLSLPQAGQVNAHIFASPATAAIMVGNIGARLALLDPANADIYAKNGAHFVKELKELSAKFRALGKKAANNRIILEHDGLAYLAANASLQTIAIVENSASAAELTTIRKLAEKEKPALLAGDAQYPDRLLKTLANETGLPFARLNTCSAGPANASPDYYLAVMRENLSILEKYF